MKELLDKEVVIIDREEFVKVMNPKASEGGSQPRYLYIPVNEYLSQRGAYTSSLGQKKGVQQEATAVVQTVSPIETDQETRAASLPRATRVTLKKKMVIAHFDDRSTGTEEIFGDWISERLMKEVDRRSGQILFVDFTAVTGFLQKRGIPRSDLETPQVLRTLNEVFGVNAVVSGHLSGPYVFTTKTSRDQEGTASAIIQIEARLADALSGKTLKTLSARNPILAVREKGSFSEDKAKIRAIELTVSELSRSLITEVEALDWSCRIVKVEGKAVYVNAGKLTGLKVGDVLEVFGPGPLGEKRGQVRIEAFLGIDASMGEMLNGPSPSINDVLKPAKLEGGSVNRVGGPTAYAQREKV